MRATATVLCNNIIFRAKSEKIPLSPMKLQKILYYVCVKYIKETGESPISENFEVWRYGPVVSSVYAEFKPFGASSISNYALNAKREAMMVDEDYNPLLRQCIDYVWSMFKTQTGIQLSTRTHQRGSGWYVAFQAGKDIISTEEMKNDSTI